ncbi:MAG: hypothetical protein ACRDTS_20910 [Mycobacterium sp.]
MATDSESDLKGRWKTLQLLGPVFELLNRAAPRADIDHRSYDLAQLALRLIDYIVQHQASLEGSVSLNAATDHLTQIARRMHPTDPARPYTKVVRLVFNTVFNDGRPHEATWLEPDRDGAAHQDVFRFRLLRMVDSESGAAVTATDEAILLYLQALNTDLADRALALKLMVEIQMNAGEFDKALESARQATRTARGLSASLRERLADTRRDIGIVDWHGEMPDWLSSVHSQIRQQMDRDRQLMELADLASADPDAEDACKKIADEVRGGADVWTRLEGHLVHAIPVFLEAQKTQRFRPRGLAAAIDIARDVFEPAIATTDDEVFHRSVGVLVTGVTAPPTPVCWGMGDLTDLLFKPPVSYERRDPEIDDPGELGDAPGDSIPADVAACAADVLGLAGQRPTRVSELLQVGRARAAEVSDQTRLLDVLWGAALWVFVAGDDRSTDEHPHSPGLVTAIRALTAADDGQSLHDERYEGPDLTVARSVALDVIDREALREQ